MDGHALFSRLGRSNIYGGVVRNTGGQSRVEESSTDLFSNATKSRLIRDPDHRALTWSPVR